MATPVGHYRLGLAIARAVGRGDGGRRRALLLAGIAVVPDLDVLPGLLVGELGRFHHGATHSLAAAAAFGVAGVALVGRGGPGRVLFVFTLAFLLYTSHLVLDLLTLDTGPPIGVPLLWPWSRQTFQAPWVLLPNVQHTSGPLISVHNVLLAVREVAVFLPLALLTDALKAAHLPRPRRAVWLYAGWFLMALGASLFSLRQLS